jgi:hypothetical protein
MQKKGAGDLPLMLTKQELEQVRKAIHSRSFLYLNQGLSWGMAPIHCTLLAAGR